MTWTNYTYYSNTRNNGQPLNKSKKVFDYGTQAGYNAATA